MLLVSSRETTITYYDKNIIPTIPYKWDNSKAKYINILLRIRTGRNILSLQHGNYMCVEWYQLKKL